MFAYHVTNSGVDRHVMGLPSSSIELPGKVKPLRPVAVTGSAVRLLFVSRRVSTLVRLPIDSGNVTNSLPLRSNVTRLDRLPIDSGSAVRLFSSSYRSLRRARFPILVRSEDRLFSLKMSVCRLAR